MTKTFIVLSNLAAALAATATPSFARDVTDPAVETTHVSVVFTDLDLASAAGQARLHRRIDHAAMTACADAGDGLAPATALHQITACRAEATRGAETELAARGLDLHLAMH